MQVWLQMNGIFKMKSSLGIFPLVVLKGTIKELLVLELDKKRSKNKELLELGLELGYL